MEFNSFRFVRLISKLGVRFSLFTNTDDACFFTFQASFNPECEFGKNFNSFVFFDEIHLTAKIQQLAGEAMLEAVLVDDDNDDNDERSAH